LIRYLLASRSDDKAREIRRLLAPVGIHIDSLADAGVEPAPEEDGIERFDTFRENALAKARYFAERTGQAVLADDSGIEVAALGGKPGVLSKRFSGRHDLSGRQLDDVNNATLLARLLGIPAGQRTACYVCAAVALTPGRAPVIALGCVAGRILEAARGDGGFGYDPLFAPAHETHSFAEMPPERKDRISHRARAFRALAAGLGGAS
jgi:XTP/dITP diphosphohydrolase